MMLLSIIFCLSQMFSNILLGLECPISHDFFEDPIILSCCGQAVSRLSIIECLKHSLLCPMCKADLTDFDAKSVPKSVNLSYLVESFKKINNGQQNTGTACTEEGKTWKAENKVPSNYKKILGNIIECNLFADNKFHIPEKFIDGKFSKIGYPKYIYNGINEKFLFETGPIKLVQYGISNLGKYIEHDRYRRYINLPYDANQQSCTDLFNILEKIDKLIENNKNKMFGAEAHKYKYMPLIKKNINIKLPYCKASFNTNLDTEYITTQVLKRDINGKLYYLDDIKTVTNMASQLMLGCTCKFIIKIRKMWIEKTKPYIFNYSQEHLGYGLSLGCEQVEIIYDSPDYKGLTDLDYIKTHYYYVPDSDIK